MRRMVFAAVVIALPLFEGPGSAQSAPPPASPAGVDLAALDRAADPCVDFYQFACGGWTAANPVPDDRQSWGRFQELQDRNFALLRRILETPSADRDREKASAFYAACMDEAAIERKGASPLEPELTRIAALDAPGKLPALLAALHDVGVEAFFRFGARTDLTNATRETASIDSGGFGLPDRDYYLKTDARSAEIRSRYEAHVRTMLGLIGEGADAAAAGTRAVLAIERALAEADLDRVQRRTPSNTQHPMTPAELAALTPHFDWAAYAAASGAPAFQAVNVSWPAYVKAFDALVASTPLEDIKAYLRWHLVHASAPMLSRAFTDANFDFYSRTLGGQRAQAARWRTCVTETDRRLGEALGKAFVEEAFGPQAKADMLAMVQGIKGAMRSDIESAPWMSEDTRRAALAKLDAVVDRIGYPDQWKDYSAVRIARDDALGDVERAIAFERHRSLQKIGGPVDRTEWRMTPPTVNAYYSPDRNNINFPAGILQPPFYQPGRDAAVNYGAAGAVIGHELTHGFDDQGRRFDGQGNLRDWWTPGDAKAFETRAACIADQYSQYVVAGDTHINGRLTLGENAADNGGLRLALMAYLAGPGASAPPVLGGFAPEQRVFLGWAQVWCESARPEAERLKALTNPHSSNRYRVNGPLSNMPEFQKAFSCRADAPMVRADPCRVW